MDGATPLSLEKSWPDVIIEGIRLSESKVISSLVDSLMCSERGCRCFQLKTARKARGVWLELATWQLELGAESLFCGCI